MTMKWFGMSHMKVYGTILVYNRCGVLKLNVRSHRSSEDSWRSGTLANMPYYLLGRGGARVFAWGGGGGGQNDSLPLREAKNYAPALKMSLSGGDSNTFFFLTSKNVKHKFS